MTSTSTDCRLRKVFIRAAYVGVFKGKANEITQDKIQTMAEMATKGTFDLACMVASLSSNDI